MFPRQLSAGGVDVFPFAAAYVDHHVTSFQKPDEGIPVFVRTVVKTKVKESEVKSYVNDISITPLSIPMLCGPGAITNAIVMWNKATDWETKMIMVIAVAVVITLVYLILRSSSRIIKILGETGNNVMMRLMGLIVMVIAVEFFFSGLKPIVIDILRSVG